ncbi:MAG: FG-GAP repeat domain-containing protein, partial [Phycisphaerae bacterium]
SLGTQNLTATLDGSTSISKTIQFNITASPIAFNRTNWVENFPAGQSITSNAADINRDGVLDVVVGHNQGLLRVLLGRGDGTFDVKATYSPGVYVGHSALADLNSDGLLDILASSYSSNLILVYLGSGDGLFQYSHSITGLS